MIVGGSTAVAQRRIDFHTSTAQQPKYLWRIFRRCETHAPKWTDLYSQVNAPPNCTIYEAACISPDILPVADLLPLSEHEARADSWLDLVLKEPADNSTAPNFGANVRCAYRPHQRVEAADLDRMDLVIDYAMCRL